MPAAKNVPVHKNCENDEKKAFRKKQIIDEFVKNRENITGS